MVKRRLPTAAEIWAGVPLPALTPTVLKMTKAGVYAHRLTKGMGIQGEPLYKVQTVNIFGFLDEFCMDFSEDFNNHADALSFFRLAQRESMKEYRRLAEKQRRRIQHGQV